MRVYRPHDMAKERWLPVIGYEGLYEVSSLGRVRRTDKDGTIVSQQVDRKKGYVEVTLSREGRRRPRRVHRIVADAFLPPIPGATLVKFRDGNHENNAVRNLYRATGLRIADGPDDGSFASWFRTTRGKRRESQEDAATKIGVHQMTVCRWENGESRPSSEQLAALATWAAVRPEKIVGLIAKEG